MRVNNEEIVKRIRKEFNRYKPYGLVLPWDAKDMTSKHREGLLDDYLTTIAAINSLGRSEDTLDGRSLSDWLVPSVFKTLILPSCVTIDGGKLSANLLSKSHHLDLKTTTIMSFDSFNDLGYALAASFRKDPASWLVKVSDQRDGILLSDAVKRSMTSEGIACNTNCVPLELVFPFYKPEQYYFNATQAIGNHIEDRVKEELGQR